MYWRLLEDSELSFSAVYFCDSDEDLAKVIGFGKIFPPCSGLAWWKDGIQTTVLFIFDTAIPVNDCARLYPGDVNASIFYVPSSLSGLTPDEFVVFDASDKFVS